MIMYNVHDTISITLQYCMLIVGSVRLLLQPSLSVKILLSLATRSSVELLLSTCFPNRVSPRTIWMLIHSFMSRLIIFPVAKFATDAIFITYINDAVDDPPQ
jgi:hypothetical protein